MLLTHVNVSFRHFYTFAYLLKFISNHSFQKTKQILSRSKFKLLNVTVRYLHAQGSVVQVTPPLIHSHSLHRSTATNSAPLAYVVPL